MKISGFNVSIFLKRRNLIDVILTAFFKKYYSLVKKVLLLVILYFIHNRNYYFTVKESRNERNVVDKNLE